MTRIIDLSSNNGPLTDEIADAGIDGAIVKFGGGTSYRNELLDQHIGMLRKHRIPLAAYFYGKEPTGNPGNYMQEWRWFKSLIAPYPDVSFVALDCEESAVDSGYADSWYYQCTLDSLFDPYIYTGDWFARNVFRSPLYIQNAPLWFANPGNTLGVPPPWREIVINQIDWHGLVPGVSTEVDISESPYTWEQLTARGHHGTAWPFGYATQEPIIVPELDLGGRGRIVAAEFTAVNEDTPDRPVYYSLKYDKGTKEDWRIV